MYIEPLISVKNEVSKEKLMQDLHLVMTDAEELLRATASHTGEKVSAARERIQESLSATKERLVAAQKQVTEKAKQAAKVTDEYVHENPWKAVGMGAGAGLIIGMLISRGR
ncbi:MAG: DUF883 domain-containing protein [Candidatus Nitrotoga sp.]|jgi:ElaB/YqjD/DUF883 family membrane-anchored ribosome-binding protein|nr:DUF883 domain-containing protein [Candidatus Nitrotoga sp.]